MSTLYQALVRYAKDRQLLARPYYADLRFPWQLDLRADGSLVSADLVQLDPETDAKGRPVKAPGPVRSVPTIKRTSGIAPILGADTLQYVLGWHEASDDAATERKGRDESHARHKAWVSLMRDWAASPEAVTDSVPHAIVRFLETGVERVQKPARWGVKDRVLIRVGGQLVSDSPSASLFWSRQVEGRKSSDERGHCLICSRNASRVATLPQSVKGTLIPDGEKSGVVPISINEAAFGFDLRKGLAHVPICVACAQAIPVALEHLLSSPDRSHKTPRSATSWWVEGTNDEDLNSLFSPPSDHEVRAFIDKVHKGQGNRRALTVDHFHSLTLEANGPRMVVRDWTHLPVAELRANILRWFEDTHVVPLWPSGRDYHSLGLLAMASGRYQQRPDGKGGQYLFLSDKAGRHPHGITETLRTVALKGLPLPRTVVAHLVQRVAADGHMDDPRAALLRLYFARSNTKGTVMPGLDPTNQDPSYLLGRLMAVYEAMQYAAATLADKKAAPNATFADKYLAGAITSPILILTTGGKQAQAWRSKLRRSGKGYFFDQAIESITDLLQQAEPAPTRASIENQASFLLGYHHQRAHDNRARQEAMAAKATAQDSTDAAASDDMNH